MSSGSQSVDGTRRTHKTLLPGTVLEDRYEILRVAGRGGMSTVYAARDLRFGQVERLCAVKEMFDIDPDTRVRALRLVNFERESALLATLSHPAIPRIYDYFSHGGLVYLVLEFVDGQDLERLLAARKTPFSEEQIIRWGLEIADVLQMLHAQKPDPIIFRDLKPSNVMLRQSGQIVLIDFGIARTIQGRQRGTMIGTEGYAPPEQYRGIADARGDIYALGATLHHLATNSDPRLETPFTFQERPIRALNPDISDELSAVIMKMLAYNPTDRYQSVTDVRADLEAVQRKATIVAYGLHHSPVAPPVAPLGETEPATEEGALDAPGRVVPAAPLSPRQIASKKRAARRRRSEPELITERLVWATRTGDEVRGSATFDGQSFLIGSYDHYLYAVSPIDGSVRWRYRSGRGVVTRPVVLEHAVVFGSEDHSIYAVDRVKGTAIWSHRTGMPVRSSPLAAKGRIVIGSDDAWVYALDPVTGKVVWRQRTWGPVRSSPAEGRDAYFVGCDDSHLYALDTATGKTLWRTSCGGPVQSAPLLLGSIVVAASRSGFVSAFGVRHGERTWQFDARAPVIASPRVVNDTVIFGVADGSMVALAVEDGKPRWSARFANQITATALLAGEVGYVGTVDGDCVCFATSNGDVIWRFQVGGGIVSTPAYGNGVLVVGSTDGRICGLALTEAETYVLEKGK
jgi:outer membrane protein assembly factor BamB/tRNA A-37 threonylcarbamoyl transferase component Bud32